MTSTYKNNRDANEREIIDALRAAGCYVQQMDRKDGFDLLVVKNTEVFIMEVKNPARKWTLTNAEQKLQEEMGCQRAIYWIIEYPQEALNVIQQS
jgi:hypothetical protein